MNKQEVRQEKLRNVAECYFLPRAELRAKNERGSVVVVKDIYSPLPPTLAHFELT